MNDMCLGDTTLTPSPVSILCCVFLAVPALGNRDGAGEAPPFRMDLLPSCTDCGQKKVLNCQLLQGLLYLQKATLPNLLLFSCQLMSDSL